jgi:hypothetical protein
LNFPSNQQNSVSLHLPLLFSLDFRLIVDLNKYFPSSFSKLEVLCGKNIREVHAVPVLEHNHAEQIIKQSDI